MAEAPVELRVGDRERRVVDEQLQAAVGDGALTLSEYDERSALLWQARTRADLEALVVDLPPAHTEVALPPATGTRRVVAVMSEDRLSGVVRPGQGVSGVAVMGSAVLDLRREDLPDGTRVRAVAVMGDVEVQVPPGTQVQLSGMALMGERDVRVPPGHGPVVHVEAWALMGSIKVTVGDGEVVRAARAAVPAQRRAVEPVKRGAVARVRRRVGAGLLPLALLAGGVGVVASGTDGRVVFGSTTVEAVTDTDVEVSVVFGSVQVVVPDEAIVERDGLVVFGSVECERACDGKGTGPVISVRSVGGFGSVDIVTQSELEDGEPEPR